jgi:hypothetical protein
VLKEVRPRKIKSKNTQETKRKKKLKIFQRNKKHAQPHQKFV